MLKRVSAILVLILLFSLGPSLFAQPRGGATTALSYVSAFMEGRLQDAYAMLGAGESEGVSFVQYENYIRATFPTADLIEPMENTYPTLYRYVIENLFDLKVVSVDESDGKTLVDLRLATIDLLTLTSDVSEAYPEINSSGLSDIEVDEIYKKAIDELYAERDPPKTVIELRIEVTTEGGRRVIYAGLRESFDRMRAGELSGAAWNARTAGRTEYATILYREAVELDPENDVYRQELEVVETRFQAMKKLLALSPTEYVARNLSIAQVEVLLTGTPVFICDIWNSGGLTLNWLEARVVYLDEEDLIMDVETIRLDFGAVPLRSRQVRNGIRFNTNEAPFGWNGERFRLELLDAGL